MGILRLQEGGASFTTLELATSSKILIPEKAMDTECNVFTTKVLANVCTKLCKEN